MSNSALALQSKESKDVHARKISVTACFLQGLSLALVREARGGLSSWFSAGKPPSSITDCLAAFTADETLQVAAVKLNVMYIMPAELGFPRTTHLCRCNGKHDLQNALAW